MSFISIISKLLSRIDWIVIGECLNSIHHIGGAVVSVTTDGFITDIENLESKLSKNYLFASYKKIRLYLCNDDTALELKHEGVGILSWTTRGQLGFESKIIATTGLQHFYTKNDMVEVLVETFKSEGKIIEYIQSRLRSPSDIYKKGGHVTMIYKDQNYRMHFDNKRVLEAPIERQIREGVLSEVLMNSRPLSTTCHGENLRYISKIPKVKQYSRFSGTVGKTLRYKKMEDLAVQNFVKGLLSNPPMFNLHRVGLESYKAIVSYIKNYNSSIKITEDSIASLKNRSIKWKSVPKTKETEAFVKYLLNKFKIFDEGCFFRL